MSQTLPLTLQEQEVRRKAVQEALVNTRLEGLEPHPIFFELVEQYIRGEITIEQALTALQKVVHVRQ